MPLSAEQAKQAIAAKRLQEDPALQATLDRIVEAATGSAIYLDDPRAREDNRMLVIAVTRLRMELQADADLPEELQSAEALARSME